MSKTRLALTLAAFTLARLVLNASRRFPYIILTPMAAALGVPRSTVEGALSLEWASGAIGPVAGPYIDRLGRKRMMLIGMSAFIAFTGLAALGQTAALVLFGLVAGGFGKTLFDPAMQAYVGDRTPYQWRGMAIGITELAWSASLFIIGPLAAYLIAQAGLNAIFAVIAVAGLVALAVIALVVPGDRPAPATHAHLSFGASLRVLRGSRPAIAILLVAVCVSLAAEAMIIVYEAWLRERFTLNVEILGTVAWVISAAEVIGEGLVIAVSDRFGKRRLTLVSMFAVGLAYFILPLTGGNLTLALVAVFGVFLTFETSIVVLIPLATEVLPDARGTMLSAYVAALAGGRAVGTLLGGAMFRSGGLMLNGTVALCLNLIAVTLIWRFVHEQTNMKATAVAAEPAES